MANENLPNPIPSEYLERLDPEYVEYHNANLAWKPMSHTIDMADLRAFPKKYAQPWYRDLTFEPFVKDIKIPSQNGHQVTARCYHPDPRTSPFGEGPYPVHINFHGGGFVFGDLTSDADLCMMLRNRAGILVVDVDYRLAPEHVFGKGHDDAWAAIRWVHEHGGTINAKTDSISIGGISAGGHITAVMQQLAAQNNISLKLAILAVPMTACHFGYTSPASSRFASIREHENGPFLNWSRIFWFLNQYKPKNKEEEAQIATRPKWFLDPIDGDYANVCPSYIGTADCDPIRDEGEEYARHLIENGVRVTVRRFIGVGHVFMNMVTLKKSQLYVDDICAELSRAHSS